MAVKLSSFRKTKTLKIDTNGGELNVEVRTLTAGDEMEANQISTQLINLKEMAKKKQKGEEVEMSEHVKIDQVKLNIFRVLKGIIKWDLIGDDDTPLPITEETLKMLPTFVFDKISTGIDSCSYVPTEDELKNSKGSPKPSSETETKK